MNKKYVVMLIIVVVLALSFGVWLSFNQPPAPVLVPSPLLTNASPPSVLILNFPETNSVKSVSNYNLTPSVKISQQPLPVYAKPELSTQGFDSDQLIRTLNMGTDFQKTQTSKEIFYYWKGSGAVLTVNNDFSQFNYLNNVKDYKTMPNDPGVYDVLAKQLISSSKILSSEKQLSPVSTSYLLSSSGSGEPIITNQEQSNRVVLQYSLLVGGVPLISDSALDNQINIKYSTDKNVVSFSSILYPEFKNNSTFYPLLSLDDLKTVLSKNQAKIISASLLYDPGYAMFNEYDLATVDITNIRLAYYFSPKNTSLLPVFILSGISTDKNTKEKVNIEAIVKAVK